MEVKCPALFLVFLLNYFFFQPLTPSLYKFCPTKYLFMTTLAENH